MNSVILAQSLMWLYLDFFYFFCLSHGDIVGDLGSLFANSMSVWFAAQKLMYIVPYIAKMKPTPLVCSLQPLN